MGTWNAEIFGNDTSCEVQEYFYEKYNLEFTPNDINKLIENKFNNSLNDFEDRNNVVFALAYCLWETKSLKESKLLEIKSIIEKGGDLQTLKGLGATEQFLNDRKKHLTKFYKKISTEKTNPKRRVKPPKEIQADIQTGTCLSFKYSKELFGGIIVIDSKYYKNKGQLRFALTNIKQKKQPDFKTFLKANLANFDWEIVYGQAFRKAAFEDKTARIYTYPLSYHHSTEREKYFEFNDTFFEICGQLSPFTQCLLGTSGIRVEYKKEYNEFEKSLTEELVYLKNINEQFKEPDSSESIEELNNLLNKKISPIIKHQ